MAELPVDVINNPAIVLPKTLTYLEVRSCFDNLYEP